MKDLTKSTYIKVKPSLTHAELIEAWNNNEQLVGFQGGAEVPISLVDNLIDVDIIPTQKDEEGNALPRKTWEEVFPIYKSLDNTKAIILICDAIINIVNNRRSVSWTWYKDGVMLFKVMSYLIPKYGESCMKTKSEYLDILDSDEYKSISNLE